MGNELVNYNEQLAQMAQRLTTQEQIVAGTFLSTKGGTLAFGDEQMPGNQACVIVLDAVMENTYYAGAYDPENAEAPTCYAFGRDAAEDMGPHPSMQSDLSYFIPQSDTCKGCQWNVYGTADKGKGKACQNRRRLALIPAGFYSPKRGSRDFDLDLITDLKHYAAADIAFLKLPVTSVKNWSKYAQQVSATHNTHPLAVVTRLFLEPDPKFQYQVHFEMLDTVPEELIPILLQRYGEADKLLIQGYKAPDRDAAKQTAAGVRTIRR
jgi:hypothetical protein